MQSLHSDLLEVLRAAGARTAQVVALADVHRSLWDLEDTARSTTAEDATIAQTKREIDIHNARRHACIDAINVDTYESVGCSVNNGVRFSETPGELVDRLLILQLKMASNMLLANDLGLAAATRKSCYDAHSRLQRWHHHLIECLRDMLRKLADGHAHIAPRAERKMYNHWELNPILRRERSGDTP